MDAGRRKTSQCLVFTRHTVSAEREYATLDRDFIEPFREGGSRLPYDDPVAADLDDLDRLPLRDERTVADDVQQATIDPGFARRSQHGHGFPL